MDHVKDYVWTVIAVSAMGVFFYNTYALLLTQRGDMDNLVYSVLSAVVAMVALMMDGT